MPKLQQALAVSRKPMTEQHAIKTFDDKEKFEAWNRPPLVIGTKELLVKLKDIIKTFDDNIVPTEKAIY